MVSALNEAVLANKERELKAFFIFVNDKGKENETPLTIMATKAKAGDVALAYLPTADEAVDAYKVNLAPEVKNTVMLYRNRRVTGKLVNLKMDEAGKAELAKAIETLLAK